MPALKTQQIICMRYCKYENNFHKLISDFFCLNAFFDVLVAGADV